MFDLDAYLERIGLRGRPSIAAVHRAHLTSIPFENLDPHCGKPVSLAVEDLQRKLLTERRGGYCFEQNLLLKHALEALGTEVDMFLARVRLGASPELVRPRTHLVLRVRAGGSESYADVGFGRGGLFEPVPFVLGAECVQSGWHFRIIEEASELVLQTMHEGDWIDVYSFLPHPAPLVDLETGNWFTSTHPSSPFVSGLIVSIQSDDGSRTILSDWNGLALTEQTPAGVTVIPVELMEVPEVLEERFGLSGYVMGIEGRLLPVAVG